MSKATFFNKGLLKGKLTKCEIISYDKNGNKGEFLSLEVSTGSGNKVKATMFPTKKDPKKHLEMKSTYPVNSMVEISGNISEKEYDSNGRKGIDRSLGAMSIRTLIDESKMMATFIMQGIVERIRETSDGAVVVVRYDNTYTNASNVEVTNTEHFTLTLDDGGLINEEDVVVGCNAKFKGKIFNSLEFDDYGDIVGNVQAFKVDKIENVIQPEDLVEEEAGFEI